MKTQLQPSLNEQNFIQWHSLRTSRCWLDDYYFSWGNLTCLFSLVIDSFWRLLKIPVLYYQYWWMELIIITINTDGAHWGCRGGTGNSSSQTLAGLRGRQRGQQDEKDGRAAQKHAGTLQEVGPVEAGGCMVQARGASMCSPACPQPQVSANSHPSPRWAASWSEASWKRIFGRLCCSQLSFLSCLPAGLVTGLAKQRGGRNVQGEQDYSWLLSGLSWSVRPSPSFVSTVWPQIECLMSLLQLQRASSLTKCKWKTFTATEKWNTSKKLVRKPLTHLHFHCHRLCFLEMFPTTPIHHWIFHW